MTEQGTNDASNDQFKETPGMFDPDGALSRAYLLQRGSCCGLHCKNCPYNPVPGSELVAPTAAQSE